MQVGKIQCDLCKFVGDLETFNGKAHMRTPAGWAGVHTTVRIAGERQLDRSQKNELKERIAKQFPTLHICPACCGAKGMYEPEKMLPLLKAI